MRQQLVIKPELIRMKEKEPLYILQAIQGSQPAPCIPFQRRKSVEQFPGKILPC